MHGEKILFEGLYDMSIEEAKRREKVCDQKMLLSAKEFPLSQWYQPDTAKSFFWLGRVQREAGDLTTALESLQLSLRLRKELLEIILIQPPPFMSKTLSILLWVVISQLLRHSKRQQI